MTDFGRRAASIAAIFVVVLGCVFALMYWWGRSQVDNTVRAMLKADLQNLSVAESLYFATHHRYTDVLSQLPQFVARSVVAVDVADSLTWKASAVDQRRSQACTMARGEPAAKCN